MDSNLNAQIKSLRQITERSVPLPPESLSGRTGQTFWGETPLRNKEWEEKAKQDNDKLINLGWIQI